MRAHTARGVLAQTLRKPAPNIYVRATGSTASTPSTASEPFVPVAPLQPLQRSAGVDQALIDSFGRRHRYLRISLTDRCNLRCKYCMPDEGEGDMHIPNTSPELLSTEELQRVMSLFVRMGVNKIRLTGGEPTIRSDLDRILAHMGHLSAGAPKPLSLGITTNGVRLRKFLPGFRDAGLRNINLSLDTLVSAKFPLLARKPMEWHQRVVSVLKEVAEQEEHFTLKLNVVLLKGVNEEEIGDFVNLTEHLPLEVRFLEFMPFDGNSWSQNRLVPQATMVETMQRHLQDKAGAAEAKRLPPDSLHDVANLWQVPGWRGRIGMIASMTDAFCGGCNRIRLTSSGEIRNCLFGEEGWSLRDDIRRGASDETLITTIATGVYKKNFKLGGARDMQELQAGSSKRLPMVALGG